MLYFRDYHWLLVHGYSHFYAYITPQHRKTEQVGWFLDVRYEATGPAWRRVTHRPQVWLQLHGFHAPAGSWQALENLSFWELPTADDWWPIDSRGLLDFDFRPPVRAERVFSSGIGDHLWRVAARDGRWFTVEMALVADDYDPEEQETLSPLIASTGEEEAAPPPRWKERAELYLIEQIPFGTVRVRVPRNARDLEKYALARASELIGGLGEPEKIQLNDHSRWAKAGDDLRRDIFVELHFHGHYER